MFSKHLFKPITAGAIVLGLGFSLAYAAADDQIKARQAEMKANGKAMGALAAIMKGEAPYDAAVVKASLDAMAAADAAAAEAKAWDASSMEGATVETWAKPEIWAEGSDIGAKYQAWVDARAALAATTDEAGFSAAFPALARHAKAVMKSSAAPRDNPA
jgi:cytochrome c556